MSVTELSIGIELEGYWKGKAEYNLSGHYADHEAFAVALVPHYDKKRKGMLKADFSNGPHPGHLKAHIEERRWRVTTDPGIGENILDSSPSEKPEGHPLEFVSHILTFGRNSKWREEVNAHMATLLELAEVEVDGMCATHVHVSLGKDKPWSLEQLKQIAKAIIYFNGAFQDVYAPSRREHGLTQSNKVNNWNFKTREFNDCCKPIDQCATKRDLYHLMQAGESKYAPVTRDYAWNFENTVQTDNGKKPINTIEFRCAPGVTTAAHGLIWVEFGVSFVQAASQCDTSRMVEYEADAEGLEKFILAAAVDGMNDRKRLAILFQDPKESKAWHDDKQMIDAFDKKLKDL